MEMGGGQYLQSLKGRHRRLLDLRAPSAIRSFSHHRLLLVCRWGNLLVVKRREGRSWVPGLPLGVRRRECNGGSPCASAFSAWKRSGEDALGAAESGLEVQDGRSAVGGQHGGGIFHGNTPIAVCYANRGGVIDQPIFQLHGALGLGV